MLISSGLKRRCPELRYDPPKLAAGFGLHAGVYEDAGETEEDLDASGSASLRSSSEGSRKSVSNVFDYDGCCLFSFIFVGYVSLSPLSFRVERAADA